MCGAESRGRGETYEGLFATRKLEECAWEGQVVRLDHLEVRVAVGRQVVQRLEVIDGEKDWVTKTYRKKFDTQ